MIYELYAPFSERRKEYFPFHAEEIHRMIDIMLLQRRAVPLGAKLACWIARGHDMTPHAFINQHIGKKVGVMTTRALDKEWRNYGDQ